MPRPEAFISGSVNKALAGAVWDRALGFRIHPYDVIRRSLNAGLEPLPTFPRNELRRLILSNHFCSAEKPYLGTGSPEEFSQALGVGNWKIDEITYVEHFYMAAFTTCFFSEELSTLGSVIWDVIGGPLAALIFRDTWESKWAKIKHDLTQAVTCNVEGANFGKQFWKLLQNEWTAKIIEGIVDDGAGGAKPPTIPPKPGAPVPPGVVAPPRTGETYLGRHTVGQGDWLSKIAGYWYQGDVLLWPVIFEANRAVIGANPNVVKAGQVLNIPSVAGYSQLQLDAIRRKGRDWRSYNK